MLLPVIFLFIIKIAGSTLHTQENSYIEEIRNGRKSDGHSWQLRNVDSNDSGLSNRSTLKDRRRFLHASSGATGLLISWMEPLAFVPYTSAYPTLTVIYHSLGMFAFTQFPSISPNVYKQVVMYGQFKLRIWSGAGFVPWGSVVSYAFHILFIIQRGFHWGYWSIWQNNAGQVLSLRLHIAPEQIFA